MTNLRQRVISGVVLAVVVLLLTWAGGFAFRLLAAAIGIAILYEWTTMAGLDRNRLALVALYGLAAVPLALALAGLSASIALAAAGVCVLVALALDAALGRGWWGAPGVAYAVLPAIAMMELRGAETAGLAAILFLFTVVWATDIFAYFVGRAVGGPKLAPSISPGKTWSGAIGGTVSAVVAGLAVSAFAGPGVTILIGLSILVLSAISQAGDLFESWVKRRHGAKDSSSLIPGHGGVMDRVDGLVAAAIALYVIDRLASGAGGLFAAPPV